MANYLVSIVGGQTLPNILPIKELGTSVQRYIFISTSKVAKELAWTIQVCGLKKDDFFNLEVDEDDISQINKKLTDLSKIIFQQEDDFLINLTGGTKIMALGAFQFFSQSQFRSKMFYLNVGSNILRQVYPTVEPEKRDQTLSYRLNVEEFLGSYGAKITNSFAINKLVKSKDYTNLFYANEYSRREIIREIRKIGADSLLFDSLDNLVRNTLILFLKEIEFKPIFSDRLTKEERQYLIGGWWEEYCFHQLQRITGIQEPYMVMGLKNDKTNNELDIVFVKDNVLHVFECKTAVFNKDEFEDYVYKLAAIKDNKNGFGITVKAFLLAKHFKKNEYTGEFDPTFKRRAQDFNITLIDDAMLKSESFQL
ncbi:MAG: Card1-like endonuclease domain-containing protein [Spirosomataceae bacterium]